MIINSFKTKFSIYDNPFGLPEKWNLKNYQYVFTNSDFMGYFMNSILVVVISLALTLALGAFAAYALANWKGKASNLVFFFIVAGMMLPIRIASIRLIQIVKALGLLNTIWGLIPIYVAMGFPVSVFIMTAFIRSVPGELTSEMQAVFRQPFLEQVAFFRQKLGNLVPTARWDDLWKSQHDHGFMVAGAMKADLLADFAQAVTACVAQGKSLEWFRANFDSIVEKHGWAYKGPRDWRTRVIYQTNMLTSYAAGRLAQLREFPLWIYRHSDLVTHPRPHHVVLDGLILPSNHHFWRTHYPPNGWGCCCYVLGARDAEDAR